MAKVKQTRQQRSVARQRSFERKERVKTLRKQVRSYNRSNFYIRHKNLAKLRDAAKEQPFNVSHLFAYVILFLLALYWVRIVIGNSAPDFSFTRLLSGLSQWSNSVNLAVQPVKWDLPNWLSWLNDLVNLMWLPLGYSANFISSLVSFIVYVFQFFLFS